MSDGNISANYENINSTKQKATELIDKLRTLASSVDNRPFGPNAHMPSESTGPVSDAMKNVNNDLKDVINAMADSGERLLLLLIQAGITFEEMDTYLATSMNTPR